MWHLSHYRQWNCDILSHFCNIMSHFSTQIYLFQLFFVLKTQKKYYSEGMSKVWLKVWSLYREDVTVPLQNSSVKCKIDLKFIWDPYWSCYIESNKTIWLDFCMVTKMFIVEHSKFINVTFMLLHVTFVLTFDNILIFQLVTFSVTTTYQNVKHVTFLIMLI